MNKLITFLLGDEATVALKPRSHFERVAAVDKVKTGITARLARETTALRKQLGAAEEAGRRDLEGLDEAARKRTEELAAELVRDTRAALKPLVDAWMTEPSRRGSGAMGQVLRDMAAREAEQCPVNSTPRPVFLLGFVFADALIARFPAATNVFGAGFENLGTTYSAAIGGLQRAIAADSSVALFKAIEVLEREVEDIAKRAARAGGTVDARNAERWALVRECSDDREPLAAFDAEMGRRDTEAAFKNYSPPTGDRPSRLVAWLRGG